MSSGMPDWLAELAAQSEDSGDVVGQLAPDSGAVGDIGDLDDLRTQIESSDTFAVDEDSGDLEQPRSSSRKGKKRGRVSKGLLAMQRFVLSVLLFFNVAVIGFIFMIILGRFAF